MSTPPETTTISTEGQSQIFKELEEYRWDKDPEFQIGLRAILGPNPKPSQVLELTLRAQVFYYSRKRSVPIDFDAYKTYLSTDLPPDNQSTSSSTTANIPSESASQPLSTPQTEPLLPTTQPYDTDVTMAPKSNRCSDSPNPVSSSSNQSSSNTNPNITSTLNTNTTSTSTPSTNNNNVNPPPTMPQTHTTSAAVPEENAPYPPSFSQIVDLIASGAPIPGIREIPNIVLTGQGSIPKEPKLRKPWELPEKVSDAQVQGHYHVMFGDHRDDPFIQQEYSSSSSSEGGEGGSSA